MKPIAVGDLVQVVRWSCCGVELGKVFVVASMSSHDDGWFCRSCRGPHPSGTFALDGQNRVGAVLPWLKRIPPLDELEGVKTEETLKETA